MLRWADDTDTVLPNTRTRTCACACARVCVRVCVRVCFWLCRRLLFANKTTIIDVRSTDAFKTCVLYLSPALLELPCLWHMHDVRGYMQSRNTLKESCCFVERCSRHLCSATALLATDSVTHNVFGSQTRPTTNQIV